MRVAILPILLAVALLAGCGGGSHEASPPPTPPPPPSTTQPTPPATPPPPQSKRIFKKSELKRIALQPTDAPADLGYVPSESGPHTLGEIFILPRQSREARAYGFRGAWDAVFAAKDPSSDRRVAERVWLFKDRKGAKGWLRKSEEDSIDLDFAEIGAPLLGDESWAGRGAIQFATGGEAISHMFRLGNAVFVVSTYGAQTPITTAGALAAARAALARAKRA